MTGRPASRVGVGRELTWFDPEARRADGEWGVVQYDLEFGEVESYPSFRDVVEEELDLALDM